MSTPQCISEVTEPYVRKWHRDKGISLQCRSHDASVAGKNASASRSAKLAIDGGKWPMVEIDE